MFVCEILYMLMSKDSNSATHRTEHVMFVCDIQYRILCKDRKAWTNPIHKVVRIHTLSLDCKCVTLIIMIISMDLSASCHDTRLV
jgi:hypothetical protein